MVSILASGPSCPAFDYKCLQKIYVPKVVNIAEVNQWLEEVAQTHLVLASGKLMLQKIIVLPSIPCLQQLI